MKKNAVTLKEVYDQLEKFLNEKGVMINSCGCCGGPWIEYLDFPQYEENVHLLGSLKN